MSADDEDEEPLDPGAAAEGARRASEVVAGGLASELATLAATDPDVEVRAAPGVTEYAVGDVVFATVDGRGVSGSFRLRPEIAMAALRTGGVRRSERGPSWVTFEPRVWDRYALDRATAWFELGRKLAAG
jgi:hypothetical protein